jgi:hypothetical protein
MLSLIPKTFIGNKFVFNKSYVEKWKSPFVLFRNLGDFRDK